MATLRTTSDTLTFKEFSYLCRARTSEWDGLTDAWTLSDWFMALGGEVGEAMNVAKKMRRLEVRVQYLKTEIDDLTLELATENDDTDLIVTPEDIAAGHRLLIAYQTELAQAKEAYDALHNQLADELGDVMAYLDLVADKACIPWPEAIMRKFNAVSDREHLDYYFQYIKPSSNK